jgi:protein-disulfide isomerase
VSDLRSAPPPPVSPADRLRGDAGAPLLLFYGDYTCARCALAHARLHDAPLRIAFRHFALAAKHPRAVPLASAAEAAGLQGRFWEFHDALFADPGRTDDPHLWAHASALGLDLARFELDRRSAEVADRVREQTRAGMRAGIAQTPTFFHEGTIYPGVPDAELIARLTGSIKVFGSKEKTSKLRRPKGGQEGTT